MATRQRPAPVDQAEQEEGAERQEDVGRVELVAEGAGVAARHLPGHLVTRSTTRGTSPVCGIDDDQRHLLVAGEVGDLPVAVDHARRSSSAPACSARCSTTFGSRSAIAIASRLGYLRRSRRAPAPEPRAAAGEEDQRADERRRASPSLHSPKCSSTTGATSRSVHCSRSAGRLGAAADEEQRARASRRACSDAVAAAAGVADAAPVDRLEAGRERDDEVAGVRGASAPSRPGPAGRGTPRCAAGRPRRSPRAPPSSPSTSQRPPRRSATSPPGRKRSRLPARSTTAHSSPAAGIPGSSRRSGSPSAPSSRQTRSTPSVTPSRAPTAAGSARSPSPGSR